MENMGVDSDFWKGKKVFLTGHTGFKGSWLTLWLHQLGAVVTGYALQSPTEPSLFEDANIVDLLLQNILGDIRDGALLTRKMQKAAPEIVIHMAAQSLVRESYIDPVETYAANVMGTVNVLEAARNTYSVKAILNITTDKCYENREWVWGYRENEPMGGHDPYSSSKGCAELVSLAYRRSFLQPAGIALATARAGNVIGGGDWAKDRIVPDAMRAFMNRKILKVRNPLSTRPWQHVLEPLTGYLMLCQQLIEHPESFSDAWNFGPNDADAQPVSRLADIMTKNWGQGAGWQLDAGAHPHEANYLKLDCSKAKSHLKWRPIWNLSRALEETVQWYKARHNRIDMNEFSIQQIASYQKELESQ
jgi:CDP-glucose 4,6-dehydratase